MDAAARQQPSTAYTVTHPAAGKPTTPFMFASPHSGRDYSEAFLVSARLDAVDIRQSEDCFVDELFADAPELGAPLLAARFPRAFCDVNREQWELDPGMFTDRLPPYCNTGSPRALAGFGTIARVVGEGEAIYRRKLSFEEARARIEACWTPYHAALTTLIRAARARHDACLLIDCHSMPSERGRQAAGFVLGDNHGTSCAGAVTSFMEAELTRTGHRVRRNDPYAGGFVTRHYGDPAAGVHVLQLEVARSLYWDERRRMKASGFDAVRRILATVIAALLARPDILRQGA